jgi:TM2 domain-containing membrane protein YozV
MKHSLRGALLSGAVFPGLGQMVLRHYVRGITLMLVVSACLFVIVGMAVKEALAILETIQMQTGAIDSATLSRVAVQASTRSDSGVFKFFLFLMVFCWLAGIVDAYRIGKKKDLEEQATVQKGPFQRPVNKRDDR